MYKSVAWKGPIAGIYAMRRQYLYYLKGLPEFAALRKQLVTATVAIEIENALDEILAKYEDFEMEHAPIVLKDYHENCAL
ncbi:hypothetical protein [Paraflavitalea speifideaquila]|uniref:hypothetical protein n=1 Tax=Paraflavitalea speifideaquila TaxID=3076558 RepID=UPI0028E8314C|nr:hypothetical protein [Paraflavitalea speifideiaquila]